MSLRIDGAREDNRKLYGACKIWHVLRRDDQDVARCTVAFQAFWLNPSGQ
ncbi:MAG: hypothetical protein ACJA1E_001832 [Paracoccaceae bacterium]|jgi:hypothetical protein